MASTSLADLTPDTRAVVEQFLASAAAAGFQVRVASTLRTCADQGTSTSPVDIGGGMTAKRAIGCRSFHVWGRAVDVTINNPTPARYAELGALGEAVGLIWGGRFASNPDPVHFEYHPGLDIKTLCPVPTNCAGALLAAGVTTPRPPLVLPRAGGGLAWLGAVVGVAVGWVWVRRR